ncbi:MAG: 50S ribosomal protein L4 [Candidatus Faecimonas sp.]|nr:50S ribosomal protein L4 [Mycoplasmatota bacterium]MDY2908424.1 50S ribosomal protein L4 [Candidatus Faecimonas sp.]
MKKVELLNLKGEKVKDINLNENVFGIEPNKNVLYDAIILSRASLRQGTHSTKNRSEVSGGGRKPWRQKGTGRARQGSIRSVQWVGGGRYGTPVPRDYSKKQNRKERRLAIKSALAYKAQENGVIVLENLNLATPKTKDMKALLETLKIADKKVLLVVKEFDDNMILASRNLQNVVLISADEINVLDVVGTNVVVFTQDALNAVEEVLK